MAKEMETKIKSTLYCNTFYKKMRNSPLFRYKVFYTVCLYGIFFGLGWGRGQLGTSLADIQLITNVDLEKGSWIVTSFFIGCTVGSPIGGMLDNLMNWNLLSAISHLIVASTYFLIPWCSAFEMMLLMYTLQGVFEGIVDTVGNAELIKVWETHGKAVYLGSTSIFCLGGIIAPVVTAPFLLEDSDEIPISYSTSLNTTEYQNTSYHNATEQIRDNARSSVLHLAFTISGCLFLLISAMYFICYFLDYKTLAGSPEKGNKESLLAQPSLPLRLKIVMLTIFSTFFFFKIGMDEVFGSFIPIFCIKQLGWSKTEGAHLLSVAFITAVLSGVCGVVLVKCLSTVLFTGLCLVLSLISTLGLAVFSIHFIDIGVWMSVALDFFAKGNVFALIFTWTNEFITPVTGKISSLYLVVGMIGSSVLPIVTGYLMDNVSLMTFCYMFVMHSAFMLVMFAVIVLCTRAIVKKYGTVSERSSKILKEVELQCEELLTETSL